MVALHSPCPLAMAADGKGPDWKLRGPLKLDSFDMGVTLGTGSFGRVRIAVHKVRNGLAGPLL